MSRLYVFGPLAGVLLGVTLSFLRLDALAWAPTLVAAILVVSLVGAMHRALRLGRRRSELAMGLVAVPLISAPGALWAMARWPSEVERRLPDADERPSGPLFLACALLWGAATTGVVVYATLDVELVGLVTGAVGLLFFVFWLPAARDAVRAIEALDDALGSAPTDAPAAEWARERNAVRAALVQGGGADRAWAADVLTRHARRGEPEARAWADAAATGDRDHLVATLAASE